MIASTFCKGRQTVRYPMEESAKSTQYVMRSPNGPALFVYDKKLAELLLSKVNAKFKQDIKLEICETKETYNRRALN